MIDISHLIPIIAPIWIYHKLKEFLTSSSSDEYEPDTEIKEDELPNGYKEYKSEEDVTIDRR